MSAKKADTQSIKDVSEPGSSAAESTAKPVIVTNRPMVKDPMVVDEDNSVTVKVKTLSPKKNGENRLEPLTAPPLPGADLPEETKTTKPKEETEPEPTKAEEEPKEEAEPAPAKAEEPKVEETEPVETKPADAENEDKPAEESKPPKTSEPEKTDTKPSETPDQTTDETPDEADKKDVTDETATQEAELAAKKAAEHDQAITKLVDSKQYYLPVNSVEKRRSKRAALLGIVICLLLAIAWLDLALDAGLIQINGVKPLTHFFYKP